MAIFYEVTATVGLILAQMIHGNNKTSFKKTWFIHIHSKIVLLKQRLRTLILTLVYLRMRPGFVGCSFCLCVWAEPMRLCSGVNTFALFWLFEFCKAQVQWMKAAGDASWRTDSIFAFPIAHGPVILTSHFDIDIIIPTDSTMLSLIYVFGDISLWRLTFCQYLNSALLQSCHQAF